MKLSPSIAASTIAGLALATLAGATAANGAVRADLGPIRFSGGLTTAYASVSWPGSAQLTGSETLVVRVLTAPTTTARINAVPGAGIGGTGAPAASATLLQASAGIQADPGAGLAGGLGFAVTVAGTYAGLIDIYSGSSLTESSSFSFTTTGAPASMRVTPANVTADVGAAVSLSVTLLDAAGNVTQPSTVDSIAVTSTFGQLTATSMSPAGDPRQSLADGVASVSVSSSTAGAGSVTFTPQGTLPAMGVSSAAIPVAFGSATPTPSPTPSSSSTATPSPSATPTPTPTPSPTPTPTPTPTLTPSPTPTPSPSDPSLDGDEEPADSLTVTRLASGYRVEVTTVDGQTPFRVIASRPGSSVRWTWNNLRTNDDGEFTYRTSRNLAGARVRLVVAGLTVARTTVPSP
jgi:hypothetical protein